MKEIMQNFVKKITSRKFIVTIITIVAGLAVAFKSSSDEKLQAVGCIVAGVSAIAYAFVEGKVDAAGVKSSASEILKGLADLKSEGEDTNEENK